MANEQEKIDIWGYDDSEIESFRQERYHKNLRKKKIRDMNSLEIVDEIEPD